MQITFISKSDEYGKRNKRLLPSDCFRTGDCIKNSTKYYIRDRAFPKIFGATEEEEMENDLPFYSGLVNLTKAEIVSIQSEPSPGENVTERISPGDKVTQPLTDANTTATPDEQIQQSLSLCSDGNPPDSSTGLCVDGLPPPSGNLSATSGNFSEAGPTATPDEQIQQSLSLCSDGNPPDSSTGLCVDGLPPPSGNLSLPLGTSLKQVLPLLQMSKYNSHYHSALMVTHQILLLDFVSMVYLHLLETFQLPLGTSLKQVLPLLQMSKYNSHYHSALMVTHQILLLDFVSMVYLHLLETFHYLWELL